MKKIKQFFALALAFAMFGMISAGAAEPTDKVVSVETHEIVQDDVRLVLTRTIYESEPLTRSTAHTKTVDDDFKAYNSAGNYLGTFRLVAKFEYDGSSVSVLSHKASATPASGCTASPSSSASGGRVKGKCTYSGKYSGTANHTITCDKNGNIT